MTEGLKDWIEAIAEVDPDVGRPELWQEDTIDHLICEQEKTGKLLHLVLAGLITSGLSVQLVHGALWTVFILGLYMGQKSSNKQTH